MKQAQKTVQPRPQKRVEDDDLPTEVNSTSQEVSDDACCMIEEIDCCLADAEAEQEAAEKTLKATAKAEWDGLRRNETANYYVEKQIWMAKYQHLFQFCCGVPKFDDD